MERLNFYQILIEEKDLSNSINNLSYELQA
jgi:hypothetical protein